MGLIQKYKATILIWRRAIESNVPNSHFVSGKGPRMPLYEFHEAISSPVERIVEFVV
jgi:hypothetical protein